MGWGGGERGAREGGGERSEREGGGFVILQSAAPHCSLPEMTNLYFRFREPRTPFIYLHFTFAGVCAGVIGAMCKRIPIRAHP